MVITCPQRSRYDRRRSHAYHHPHTHPQYLEWENDGQSRNSERADYLPDEYRIYHVVKGHYRRADGSRIGQPPQHLAYAFAGKHFLAFIYHEPLTFLVNRMRGRVLSYSLFLAQL